MSNRSLRVRALFAVLLPAVCVPGGTNTNAQIPMQWVRINAPYVQTPSEVVSAMLHLAGVTREDTVYDLGSGDGRIVIRAAKDYGAHGVGIDLNPDLIRTARRNASREGVSSLVSFVQQDFFDADLNRATVVTLYLLPEVNRELLPRLLQVLRPGTRIVSHAFDFGRWKPDKSEQVNGCKIFMWVVRNSRTALQ